MLIVRGIMVMLNWRMKIVLEMIDIILHLTIFLRLREQGRQFLQGARRDSLGEGAEVGEEKERNQGEVKETKTSMDEWDSWMRGT